MDWGTVSGIALAMAAITLVMDWVMQYWLVIRWGPNITQELVISKFKDRKVAAEVREALDLPTRAETKELTDKLNQLDTIFSVKMAEIMGKMDAIEMPDLAPLEAKLDKPFEIPAEMVQDIVQGVTSSLSGQLGAELKAERKGARAAVQELQDEYVNSPEWEEENKARILAVQQYTPGKSYAMARAAVKRGPAFVDSIARANLPRGTYAEFRKLMEELDSAPAEKTATVGAGWLTR